MGAGLAGSPAFTAEGWWFDLYSLAGTTQLSKSTGDIVLGFLKLGLRENPRCKTKFDEPAQIHERREVADARRLLHVVRHN